MLFASRCGSSLYCSEYIPNPKGRNRFTLTDDFWIDEWMEHLSWWLLSFDRPERSLYDQWAPMIKCSEMMNYRAPYIGCHIYVFISLSRTLFTLVLGRSGVRQTPSSPQNWMTMMIGTDWYRLFNTDACSLDSLPPTLSLSLYLLTRLLFVQIIHGKWCWRVELPAVALNKFFFSSNRQVMIYS